jgi:hypothetical protein
MSYRVDPVTGKKQVRTEGGGAWTDIPPGQEPPNFDKLAKGSIQESGYDARTDPTVTSITQPPPSDSRTGSSVTVPPVAGTGTGASNTEPPTTPPATPTTAPTPPAPQSGFDFNTLDDAGKQALFQSMRPWLQQQRQTGMMGRGFGKPGGFMPPGQMQSPTGPESITDPTTGSIITPDHPGYADLRKTLGMPEMGSQAPGQGSASPMAYKYSQFPRLTEGQGPGMPQQQWGPGMQNPNLGMGQGMGMWGGSRAPWSQGRQLRPQTQQQNTQQQGFGSFQMPGQQVPQNDPRQQLQSMRQGRPSSNPYTGFGTSSIMKPTPQPGLTSNGANSGGINQETGNPLR